MREGGLLAEGLHGHQLFVFESLGEVDGGEVALTNLTDRLEEAVETALIDTPFQLDLPGKKVVRTGEVEAAGHVSFLFELDADGRARDFRVLSG